jgi:cytochrome b pre-mRNA-processing protein 3
LIDHFFLDVEDRIRAVLQPADSETPSQIDFYAPPSTPDPASIPAVKKKPGRAPDRLVKQQMQILKEQWAGLGMSLDLGLAMGDAEMAGAVWRNLLGARGARGVPYDASPGFRRSINPLTGGKMSTARLKLLERGFESEEAKDDNSGVADYPKDQLDKYVAYPELMADIVAYIHRELKRLEGISDDDVLGVSKELGREGRGVEVLKFGKIRR